MLFLTCLFCLIGNNSNFDGINRQADTFWSSYLEQTGQADTLFLQLSKPK